MGKVGCLVGLLLNEQFTVCGLEMNKPYYNIDFPFDIIEADVSDIQCMRETLKTFDAVVSALPYFFNKAIAEISADLGVHYFDLTEDVKTTHSIRELAEKSKGVMIPQCGLAPGYIGILGSYLANKFTKVRDIELRVGALPRYPNGLLAYSFTWSSIGVLNEYINDAEVIHNGKRKNVPSLDGLEYINIEGQEFEAFTTSGGVGTMCETYEGQVDTLNYKSIRYPGHGKLMSFLMYELLLKNDRKQLEKILTEAKPPVSEDVVYVYAVVEGWCDDKLLRKEFYKAYYPKKIKNIIWRAISWTTAASICAVVEMVSTNKLPKRGFIKQEDISFDLFKKTKYGHYFE